MAAVDNQAIEGEGEIEDVQQRLTESEEALLDKVLDQLLFMNGEDGGKFDIKKNPPDTRVELAESDIQRLCNLANPIFLSENSLLELRGPIHVIGDIHGQYYDLLRVFQYGGFPPASNYLFLGDYVDRGYCGIEVICLLLCYKIRFRNNFFMLRGNHESATTAKNYGFFEECRTRYNSSLFKTFTSMVFDALPFAATIGDQILCVHAGIGPDMKTLADIRHLKRPVDVPDQGTMCDLVWSDPDPSVVGFTENERGVSHKFGNDVLVKYLDENKLALLVRAHQVVPNGYEFIANKRLLTIFTAPNYCGEYENRGAFLYVDKELKCRFQVMLPNRYRSHRTLARSRSSSRDKTPMRPRFSSSDEEAGVRGE